MLLLRSYVKSMRDTLAEDMDERFAKLYETCFPQNGTNKIKDFAYKGQDEEAYRKDKVYFQCIAYPKRWFNLNSMVKRDAHYKFIYDPQKYCRFIPSLKSFLVPLYKFLSNLYKKFEEDQDDSHFEESEDLDAMRVTLRESFMQEFCAPKWKELFFSEIEKLIFDHCACNYEDRIARRPILRLLTNDLKFGLCFDPATNMYEHCYPLYEEARNTDGTLRSFIFKFKAGDGFLAGDSTLNECFLENENNKKKRKIENTKAKQSVS